MTHPSDKDLENILRSGLRRSAGAVEPNPDLSAVTLRAAKLRRKVADGAVQLTVAVVSPTPGMSFNRPASARKRSSDSGTREISRAARRNACWRGAGARPRNRRSAMRSRASTGVMGLKVPPAQGVPGGALVYLRAPEG